MWWDHTVTASTADDPSPDEHPFTPIDKLPQPVIDVQHYPPLLYQPAASHPDVNVNDRIKDFYVNHIVPGITLPAPGSPRQRRLSISGRDASLDDGNYGSAATRDVEVLQALSRRIHFGEWEARGEEGPVGHYGWRQLSRRSRHRRGDDVDWRR